jgi:hypothetical protein
VRLDHGVAVPDGVGLGRSVEVADGRGVAGGGAPVGIGGTEVSDGVGPDHHVEVADSREVADGEASVAVSEVDVRISSVGVMICRGNKLPGRAILSSDCFSVGKTVRKAAGASLEGIVSIDAAQASTKIPHTTDNQCPALMMFSPPLPSTSSRRWPWTPSQVPVVVHSTLRKGHTNWVELTEEVSLAGQVTRRCSHEVR